MHCAVHSFTRDIYPNKKNRKDNTQSNKKYGRTPNRPKDHENFIYDGVLKSQVSQVFSFK